jgi:hypothetical protein
MENMPPTEKYHCSNPDLYVQIDLSMVSVRHHIPRVHRGVSHKNEFDEIGDCFFSSLQSQHPSNRDPVEKLVTRRRANRATHVH